MRKTGVFRGAVAACVLSCLVMLTAGCQVKPPIVKLNDIEVSSLGLHSMDLVFVMDVINVNTVGATLESFDYELAVGRTSLSSQAGQGTRIPPQGQAKVLAPVTIQYAQVLEAMLAIRAHQVCPYEFRGRAKLKVGGANMSVPAAHSGRIAPVRLPTCRLTRLDIDKESLLGRGPVTILLVLEMTHGNGFDLPLTSVCGSVRIGDNTLLSVDQDAPSVLRSGGTTEVEIPIKVDVEQARAALKTMVRERRLPRFDGEIKFGSPLGLKRMLLGKKD